MVIFRELGPASGEGVLVSGSRGTERMRSGGETPMRCDPDGGDGSLWGFPRLEELSSKRASLSFCKVEIGAGVFRLVSGLLFDIDMSLRL
jgi:hypothetical protein